MAEIVTNIIVALIVGVVIGLLFLFLYLRKRKRSAQLLEFTQGKGWQMQRIAEALSSGYRFYGSHGQQKWIMEALSKSSGVDAGPGSSNIRHSTRWWTEPPTSFPVTSIIGPKPNSMMNSSFLLKNNPLRDAALRLLVGKDSSWSSDMEPVDFVDEKLGELYLGLAKKADALLSIQTPEIIDALVSLPPRMRPVLILAQDGLEMRLNDVELKDPGDLAKFAELGMLIVEQGK